MESYAMKKIIPIVSIILAIILLAVIVFSLITRNNNPEDNTPDHTHVFGEWITTKEPTVTAEGVLERACVCGKTETQPIAKLIPSEGLEFISNLDGTCDLYNIGSCTDKNIIIPAFSPDGDTITKINYCAFQNSDITGVIIPDTVTTILGSAFNSCASLTSVRIGSGVTYIDDVTFNGCTSLESITIPEGVQYMGDFVFAGCTSLKNVALPDSLTYIGDNMFFNCDELVFNTYDNAKYLGNKTNPYVVLVETTRDDMPFYQIHQDTKFIYDNAFKNCTSLKEIVIPDGVLSINQRAFSNCSRLETIDIPASVTSIKPEAFVSCYLLSAINVNKNNSTYKSIDGTVYTKDGSVLIYYAQRNPATEFVIPEGVTEIADSAFYMASHLVSIILPESILVINESAFSLCYSLTEVVIPESITEINSFAFSHCSSLATVYISKNVTFIDSYAFSSNDALTDVYFAGSEEEWNAITIEDNNDSLTNATIHYNCTPSN